jgi:hypothetical protein
MWDLVTPHKKKQAGKSHGVFEQLSQTQPVKRLFWVRSRPDLNALGCSLTKTPIYTFSFKDYQTSLPVRPLALHNRTQL